jgi:hypothetical protein
MADFDRLKIAAAALLRYYENAEVEMDNDKEWVPQRIHPDCPECIFQRGHGHAPDCSIGKAIVEIEEILE